MISPAPRALLEGHERRELIRIARVSLKEWMRTGRMPPGAPHRSSLLQHAGVHVTLLGHEPTRCAWCLTSEQPLYAAIAALTVQAALHHPRLPPLVLANPLQLQLRVAVLGPAQPLGAIGDQAPAAIEIGRHGLHVARGSCAALEPPHSAPGAGWSAVDLLVACCRAAGLTDDDWRQPETALSIFEAETFES